MGKYLLILLLIYTSTPLTSQKKYNPDSLLRIIPTLHDTNKMLKYHDICRYYVGVDKNKSIEAAQAALTIAENRQEDIWIARCLNVLFAALNIHGERANLQNLAERAIVHAQKSGNKLTLLEAYSSLSQYYGINSIWDKTIEVCDKSLAIALEIKDTLGIINNYNLLAICNLELNNLKKTEEYHKSAIQLSKLLKRNYELGRAYTGLAELYFRQSKWDEAVENADLGAEAFKKLVYSIGEAQSLIISASALRQKGKLDEAEVRCNKVLLLISEADNDLIKAEIEVILAYIYLERNDLVKAEKYFQGSEKVASEVKDYKQLKEIYHGLELLYSAKHNFAQAKLYKHKYDIVADSFFTSQALSNISSYQVKYETAKKEQQIAIEKEKRTRLLFGSIIALLTLISFFIYFRNKQWQKQKQTRLEAENSKLQAELEHNEANRLREVDKMKSTFFANISHEFRTPLSLIVSPLEQMINGTFKGEYSKYYSIMHRNAKRLLELVNQLLDLSKLESGKMKLQAQYGDIANLIKAMVYSHQSLADRKSIQFKIYGGNQAMFCYFDKDKVEKILSNLISNAIKFSHDHGEIEVRFNITEDNKELRITIEDHGIGISADHMSHLFDRFVKSTISEIQPGSGIGLALSKELAELHGGNIQVFSEEGKGSTFEVKINVDKSFFGHQHLSDVPMEDIETTTHQELKTSKQELHGMATIVRHEKVLLIVEDNADVRTYIKDQLQDRYQIVEAEHGKQGLEMAESIIPDIIITDVMMPEMDGYEFCKKIKTSGITSHIPVIMLTARADQSDKISGLGQGADDYQTKPFDATELSLKISNLLSHQENLRRHLLESFTTLSPGPVKAESMEATFIQKVKEAIEANFEDETFSVVELSQTIGISRSQLHRKLTAITGLGPNEIIRNMRLERAKQLIQQKSGTVSEIAYKCGFNSPAYFIKCFKDYYGKTPGEMG